MRSNGRISYYELPEDERRAYVETLRIVAKEIQDGKLVACLGEYIFEEGNGGIRTLLNNDGTWRFIKDVDDGIIPREVLSKLKLYDCD